MLPGTNRAADRFARASSYINAIPNDQSPDLTIASVVSVIRDVSWNHDSRSAKYLLNAMANCFGSKTTDLLLRVRAYPKHVLGEFKSSRIQQAREGDET